MKEEVVSSHEDLKDKYIFLEVSAWETVVLRATEDVPLSSVVEER